MDIGIKRWDRDKGWKMRESRIVLSLSHASYPITQTPQEGKKSPNRKVMLFDQYFKENLILVPEIL